MHSHDNRPVEILPIQGPSIVSSKDNLNSFYGSTAVENFEQESGGVGIYVKSLADLEGKLEKWLQTIDPNDNRIYRLPVMYGGLNDPNSPHTGFLAVTCQKGKIFLHSTDSLGNVYPEYDNCGKPGSVIAGISCYPAAIQDSPVGCREACGIMAKNWMNDDKYVMEMHRESQDKLRHPERHEPLYTIDDNNQRWNYIPGTGSLFSTNQGQRRIYAINRVSPHLTHLINDPDTLDKHIKSYENDPEGMAIIKDQLNDQIKKGQLKTVKRGGKENSVLSSSVSKNMTVDDVVNDILGGNGKHYYNGGYKTRATKKILKHYLRHPTNLIQLPGQIHKSMNTTSTDPRDFSSSGSLSRHTSPHVRPSFRNFRDDMAISDQESIRRRSASVATPRRPRSATALEDYDRHIITTNKGGNNFSIQIDKLPSPHVDDMVVNQGQQYKAEIVVNGKRLDLNNPKVRNDVKEALIRNPDLLGGLPDNIVEAIMDQKYNASSQQVTRTSIGNNSHSHVPQRSLLGTSSRTEGHPPSTFRKTTDSPHNTHETSHHSNAKKPAVNNMSTISDEIRQKHSRALSQVTTVNPASNGSTPASPLSITPKPLHQLPTSKVKI